MNDIQPKSWRMVAEERLDKIERLQTERDKFEAAWRNEVKCSAKRLARIAELEESDRINEATIAAWNERYRKHHHITTEQIDAAWGLAHTADAYTRSRDMAFALLKKFGIVRCDYKRGGFRCENGRVRRWPHKSGYEECPACKGHGWRKE